MENAWKFHHGQQLLHLGEAHEILPRRLSTVRAAYRSILGQNEIVMFAMVSTRHVGPQIGVRRQMTSNDLGYDDNI